MLRNLNYLTVTTFLAVALLAVTNKGWAGVPEGVIIDAIVEYPSEIPGLEKILFRKITLKPGASWSLAVPEQSVCQGVKGVLEVVNKTTGKIAVFNAGDCWSTGPGHEVTLSNPGAADREHLFYTLFGKKQWDRKEVAVLRSVAVRPLERAPIGASAPMGRIRQHNF